LSPAEVILAEFEHELASTRRMLERIPDQHLDYRPHAKSADLGFLGMHIAQQPDWGVAVLERSELDLLTLPSPPRATSARELVDQLERSAADFRASLGRATAESFLQPWTLRMGEQAIFTLPKAAVLRSMVMNHLVHHRGQLSVYLRLLDVPVPGIYGPSADEPFGS
jgi:uncharacterized damage-inducible protein DinB